MGPQIPQRLTDQTAERLLHMIGSDPAYRPGAKLPHMVNCLLMSTATPVRDEEHDTLYFVRRQGAGSFLRTVELKEE